MIKFDLFRDVIAELPILNNSEHSKLNSVTVRQSVIYFAHGKEFNVIWIKIIEKILKLGITFTYSPCTRDAAIETAVFKKDLFKKNRKGEHQFLINFGLKYCKLNSKCLFQVYLWFLCRFSPSLIHSYFLIHFIRRIILLCEQKMFLMLDDKFELKVVIVWRIIVLKK